MEFNQTLYRRRQLSNKIGLTLSMGAMGLGLAVLLWILFVLFSNGLAAMDLNLFTQSTPAPGSDGGGLANAIVGSLIGSALTRYVSNSGLRRGFGLFVIANIFQQEQRSDNLTKFAKCKVQFVFATGIDSLRGMVESKSH